MLNYNVPIIILTLSVIVVTVVDVVIATKAATAAADVINLNQIKKSNHPTPRPPSGLRISNNQPNPLGVVNNRPIPSTSKNCLIDNVYFEARSESIQGQLAVALVTLKRVESPKWPNNICDVVYQKRYKNGRWVGQFSWTVDGNSNIATDIKSYINVQLIVDALMYIDNSMFDFTLGATHYHATYANSVAVKWAKKLTKTVQIGQHIFYK